MNYVGMMSKKITFVQMLTALSFLMVSFLWKVYLLSAFE